MHSRAQPTSWPLVALVGMCTAQGKFPEPALDPTGWVSLAISVQFHYVIHIIELMQ